jgi:hypothetical protein
MPIPTPIPQVSQMIQILLFEIVEIVMTVIVIPVQFITEQGAINCIILTKSMSQLVYFPHRSFKRK